MKTDLHSAVTIDWSRPHVSHLNQNLAARAVLLQNVCYEIRGPVHAHAARLEAEGHRVLKLNIGNPALFGFEAPDVIMRDMIHALPYCRATRIHRRAVGPSRGCDALRIDRRVPLLRRRRRAVGQRSSELITMTMQALNDGDEVLILPDYPLWTAMTTLSGGKPVYYRCDESNGWQPDVADLESKITDRTKALLVINPNN